jgi:hypothetical protein
MKNSELCLPEGALAEAGEGGESIAPAVGDTVEFTLTGRVTRLENGEVYVKPETANGQPLEDEYSEEKDMEAEEESLKNLGDGGGGLMALLLFLSLVFAPGARGQAVAVLTPPIGTPLREYFRDVVPNNSVVNLEAGVYPVRPSILNSNLQSGNTYTGITIANKTNVTIVGVPGLTVLDGSSAQGEVLWISNCSKITIYGPTIRGYTNHAIATMPNTYLYAGVNVFKSESITFDNCTIERHADHGLQDKGAETSTGGNLASAPPSTNNMLVTRCKFEDIGGWRISAGNVYGEGTAIVPTGWTIENCQFVGCQRGIEPYDEANTDGQVFHNTIIRDNTFRNMVEFAISPAGSTNCHNALISGNTLINDNAFTYHGSNYSVGNFASFCQGFMINGGRGWTVVNNSARGNMYTGFTFGNNIVPCDDFGVLNNTATDINRGDGLGIGFWFGVASDTAASAVACSRFEVRGNKVFNTANNGFLIQGARDSVFENNRTTKGGLYTTFLLGNANFVFGNAGFATCRLTNIVVRGNTAIDNGATCPFGFGIQDNIQSMVFENNNAYNFTVSAMTNRSGSAVSILGSARTFIASIDLPAIGVGSQYTTNFAAAGVSTNDAASVFLPAQFYASGNTTNVVADAWCSNAVVYVKFANNDTVSAADAPLVRITATVRQFQAE